ncbi:MAG: serine/threonine protein kinase [Acidobacteriia bacterium]|nr:serine/threonine protein kinase [Terriglobia bacterium]
MSLRLNSAIGGYRLIEYLGRGGMGEVYLAREEGGGRLAAVKLPHSGAPGEAALRFQTEAEVQGKLHHPNIARLLRSGSECGQLYIAMEYVPGSTLTDMLRGGPLEVPRALEIAVVVADAINYIHARGIVHRDLKSSNIKIAPDGAVKLLDFGIAKMAAAPALTRSGCSIGTDDCMAPEQVRGGPVDARADIWAFGVMLYEMLAGRRPFAADTAVELYRRILEAPPPALEKLRPGVPPAVIAVVARCLRKKPGDRYQTARELWDALLAAKDPSRSAPPAHRRAWTALRERRYLLPAIAGALLACLAACPALLNRGPGPNVPAPGAPVAAAPPAPAAGDLVPVSITSDNGVWRVLRDGRDFGPTPATIFGREGETIEFTLKRADCPDFRKTLQIPATAWTVTEHPPCGGR